ncbi:MAG: VTT domain-containing protein [Acidobacteria bacterium]|nr:VTT domain-containing protein [Acidobacteriota bacterium]
MSITEIYETIKTWLLSIGVPGIFAIAVLDSSLLSLPEINDIIIVSQVIDEPFKVLYLPLVTASGSVIGCLLLYAVAWKGGDAFLRKRFSKRGVQRVEEFYARYGMLALIIPALCPPPTPFKIFVATAGALRFPKTKFIVAILFARTVRYQVEGLLAVFYGKAVLNYIHRHALQTSLIIVGSVALFYLGYRWLSRRNDQPTPNTETRAEIEELPTP